MANSKLSPFLPGQVKQTLKKSTTITSTDTLESLAYRMFGKAPKALDLTSNVLIANGLTLARINHYQGRDSANQGVYVGWAGGRDIDSRLVAQELFVIYGWVVGRVITY